MHKHKAFQSTPSVWRETVVAAAHLVRDMYFNPLPPYGGRLASDRNDVRSRHFNPLPPYGGRPWIEMPTCTHLSKFQSTPSVWRETLVIRSTWKEKVFQSTPSVWRETCFPRSFHFRIWISIHSLRMEGDQNAHCHTVLVHLFQSTPSVWRETIKFPSSFIVQFYFNPLPPYGGRLRTSSYPPETVHYFNPLPPYGGRRYPLSSERERLIFQSTPSVWRETCTWESEVYCNCISIHSLRMEGDRRQKQQRADTGRFQSTPSVWRETFAGFFKMADSAFQSTPSVWRETRHS